MVAVGPPTKGGGGALSRGSVGEEICWGEAGARLTNERRLGRRPWNEQRHRGGGSSCGRGGVPAHASRVVAGIFGHEGGAIVGLALGASYALDLGLGTSVSVSGQSGGLAPLDGEVVARVDVLPGLSVRSGPVGARQLQGGGLELPWLKLA
jgi:hypothetical protein